MEEQRLTPEQEAEAEHITEIVLEAVKKDIREMARLMVSKKDENLLGETEFDVRKICHGIGAKVIETTAERRKKGGIKVRA